MRPEVEYLGHVISHDGIKTSNAKIEKILKWPTPINEDQLRSFLGLCGYYRRHIRDYCYLAAPLEKMCQNTWNKKGRRSNKVKIPWEWNHQHEQNFNALKQALTTAPVLSFPTKDGQYILDTDACHDGIGAVLSQVQNNEEKVIAYASHRLSQSERQYCITRKELLAVYRYVIHFKHYLYGRNFTIRTDHQALVWMLNWSNPNTSQYCSWIAELENYNFEILHRSGKIHVNADAVSRIPQCEQCELVHAEPKKRRNVKLLSPLTVSSSNLCKLSTIANTKWKQEEDHDIALLLQLMKERKLGEQYPKELQLASETCKTLWKKRHNLRIRGGLLYISRGESHALIVPDMERRQLITVHHCSLGHVGVSKVTEIIKQKFYWPNMESDIQIVVAHCRECVARKVTANKLHPSCPTVTSYPFEKIAIDIAGPLPRSKGGETYILAIVDYFSKFPMLVPIRQVDAKTVADVVFKRWICMFGAPDSIHTDRGTSFESALFKEMCALAGIKKSKTAPYYPQSDALVERQFRTVKDMLYTTSKTYNRDWADVIQLVEMGLRSSIQKTNKISPFQVLFGKQMKLPIQWQFPVEVHEKQQRYTVHGAGRSEYIIELQSKLSTIRESIMQRIKQKVLQHVNSANKCIGKPYQLGDKCMARILPIYKNISAPCYEGPFVVTKKLGEWTYELTHVVTGEKMERNYYHLKPLRTIKTVVKSIHTKQPTSGIQGYSSRRGEQIRVKRKTQHPERYGFL
jgi:hypothetical protein